MSLHQYLFFNETLYKTRSFPSQKQVQEVLVEEPVLEKTEEQKIVALPKKTEPIIPRTESFVFKHKLLIVVADLSEKNRIFLEKILLAVNNSLENTDIVSLKESKKVDYQALIGSKTTQFFISFGVGLGRLGWNLVMKPYQKKLISDVHFLLADDLDTIEASQDAKRQLWAVLKSVFK